MRNKLNKYLDSVPEWQGCPVSTDFKTSQANFSCPLCEKSGKCYLDSQQQLLICEKVQEISPEVRNNITSKYDDIFNDDVKKMSSVCDLMIKALEVRKTL